MTDPIRTTLLTPADSARVADAMIEEIKATGRAIRGEIKDATREPGAGWPGGWLVSAVNRNLAKMRESS